MAGKVRVRLKHVSHLPGAEGNPGDTVSVDEARAKKWVAADGCELLDGEADLASDEPKEPKEPKAPKEPKQPAGDKK